MSDLSRGRSFLFMKSPHHVARDDTTHQVCTTCGEDKPIEQFSWRKDHKAYRRNCRQCMVVKSALWVERNQERARINRRSGKLRRAFGLTLEQYQEMFEAQGGLCALCNQEGQRRLLAVDHDHVTGRIRGLLCHICNTALGKFERIGAVKIQEYLSE